MPKPAWPNLILFGSQSFLFCVKDYSLASDLLPVMCFILSSGCAYFYQCLIMWTFSVCNEEMSCFTVSKAQVLLICILSFFFFFRSFWPSPVDSFMSSLHLTTAISFLCQLIVLITGWNHETRPAFHHEQSKHRCYYFMYLFYMRWVLFRIHGKCSGCVSSCV